MTAAGETRPLPAPFFVLATQNPIELEGTYPLPEAQLDRFLFKIDVGGVGPEVLERIVTARSADPAPAPSRVSGVGRTEPLVRRRGPGPSAVGGAVVPQPGGRRDASDRPAGAGAGADARAVRGESAGGIGARRRRPRRGPVGGQAERGLRRGPDGRPGGAGSPHPAGVRRPSGRLGRPETGRRGAGATFQRSTRERADDPAHPPVAAGVPPSVPLSVPPRPARGRLAGLVRRRGGARPTGRGVAGGDRGRSPVCDRRSLGWRAAGRLLAGADRFEESAGRPGR